jgi:peroxiredoxin
VTGPGRGVHTLLLFTKSSCPTCRWAAPFFRRLAEAAPDGLRLIGIAQDDAEDERAFADEPGLPYPIALESSPWPTSAAYGLTTVPSAVLVDPEGAVILRSDGFARDDLNDAVRRAAEASGSPVPVPFGEDVPAFRPG